MWSGLGRSHEENDVLTKTWWWRISEPWSYLGKECSGRDSKIKCPKAGTCLTCRWKNKKVVWLGAASAWITETLESHFQDFAFLFWGRWGAPEMLSYRTHITKLTLWKIDLQILFSFRKIWFPLACIKVSKKLCI